MADLPHFLRIRSEPGKRAAWVMAVAVHALLAVFLIYGVHWQSSAPEAVSVDLVRNLPPAANQQPAVPPPQRQKPPEPVPQKVPEKAPLSAPKADILRKEPKELQPVRKAVVEAPSIDPISKQLQRETERIRESRMFDEADRAQVQLRKIQAAAARNQGLADYMAKIRGNIRGKIFLPPSINGNPESEFVVTQLPSGEVLSVKLKTSSGNPLLDTAVERAIHQASPLPKPDDPSLYERELSIKYRPLED